MDDAIPVKVMPATVEDLRKQHVCSLSYHIISYHILFLSVDPYRITKSMDMEMVISY
jgi:hypothetical protein